jgi:hypothetical protein
MSRSVLYLAGTSLVPTTTLATLTATTSCGCTNDSEPGPNEETIDPSGIGKQFLDEINTTGSVQYRGTGRTLGR